MYKFHIICVSIVYVAIRSALAHFIHVCIASIGTCVDQASSSTGVNREAVSGYYMCIISFALA